MDKLRVTDSRFNVLAKIYPNFDNFKQSKNKRVMKQLQNSKVYSKSPQNNKKLKYLHLKAENPLNFSALVRDNSRSFRDSSSKQIDQVHKENENTSLPYIKHLDDKVEDETPFYMAKYNNEVLNKKLQKTFHNEKLQQRHLHRMGKQLDSISNNYNFVKIEDTKKDLVENKNTVKKQDLKHEEKVEETQQVVNSLQKNIQECIDEAVDRQKQVKSMVKEIEILQLNQDVESDD